MNKGSRLALIAMLLAVPALAQPDDGGKSLDEERAEAAKWVPGDSTPMDTFHLKTYRVVAFQYRIEFYKGAALRPNKTLTFKHPFRSFADGNILVCTNRFQQYSAQNDHEKRMVLLRGGRYDAIEWKNEKGQLDEFCGVVAPDGSVIFQFPREAPPNRVYYPLGIAKAGKSAAVFVGSYGPSKNPQSEADDVEGDAFNYNELLIWESPKSIRKKPISAVNVEGNPLKDFREGKL